MIRLRPYQSECIRAVLERIRAGERRALLHLATGTGKTLIAAKLVERLTLAGGVKVLFLVDRIQLAVQAHETFESVMPGRSYILRPGMPRWDRQVTIALLQTMISRLGEFDAREFDVVFVDECHRSVFGRWRPCVERFDAIRIGLTATPSCYSKELFGPATYRYALRRGIEEGYLSPYRIYRAMTLITKGGVRVNGTNYGPQELERMITVPDRNRKMVEEIERIAIAGKVLVYAITKKHAAQIAGFFNALRPSLGGRYAEAITTDCEDPQDAIRRFKREEYPRIAVSVGMLDTGFDCPGVVNIVFCRPTGSEILYKQIRGRGTRLCAGKRSFLMLDFVGNSERFNEGYVPPKELPLDPRMGGSHRKGGGTFVPTVVATDSWIWREWFDVAPGGEAVDLGDLAGEIGSGAGEDMWLSQAELEAG
ncbi:MAG: DEAD/DEAH box helicase family protein [Candidatus Thermoplasmatota archaeon]|nr:DEAD/DEAH box helicase family protein [Candidatus Thermoplasmatota archaeon]